MIRFRFRIRRTHRSRVIETALRESCAAVVFIGVEPGGS